MLEKGTGAAGVTGLYGDIPIHHRYTLGIAGERFFKALRDQQVFLASHCPSCDQWFLPPKIYCEHCFQDTDDWRPVEGTAYLKAFTVMHLDLEEQPLPTPEIVGLVAWEGVRGGLVHRIGEVTPEEVSSGMLLEPVWAEERTGSIADIRYFRPHGDTARH